VSIEEKIMSKSIPAIRQVKARAVVAPIARPVKNAFGVIEAAPLVLIDVATDQGVSGHAYVFGYNKIALKPLVTLVEEIGRDLVGKAIAPFDLMAAMDAKFRLLGWQGLVGMAVCGLDMAFWDALGQLAGRPVVELLGGSARPIRA
jgi:mandelate racemase